jgi:hypothetical protein
MKAPIFPLLLPLAAAALGDPRFGVMTHFAQGWDPGLASQIAAAAVTQVRDEIYWQEVEPVRGKFVFPPRFDRYFAALGRCGVAPLAVLSFANSNYDGGATPYTSDGIAGYARYGAEVVRHYGRQIEAVEIWNEYNGSFCSGPATRDRAGTYAQMLHAARVRIKAERPDVTIAGGATAGVPLPYWEKLIRAGALDDLDVLSVHPYRYNSPPEGVETEIARLRELQEKLRPGPPKPIWATEIGWLLRPPGSPGDLAVDDRLQAKFLVRAYALLLSAGVERVYWYMFRDDPGEPMGLESGRAGDPPRPAYFALGTLARKLGGARIERRERTRPDLYSILFVRPSGDEVRVMWALRPLTLTVTGVDAISDLSGQTDAREREATFQRAGAPRSTSFALDDSPIFVDGPLRGLPPPPAAVPILADSVRDFAPEQGARGWFYGSFSDPELRFAPLPSFSRNDWTEAWTGPFPYLAIAAGDQHPSAVAGRAVTAVRRWICDRSAVVRVQGSFHAGAQGDGVGVSIFVDNRRQFRALIGGGGPAERTFDLTQPVQAGTAIDFAVDPGPAANIDFDATALSAAISVAAAP